MEDLVTEMGCLVQMKQGRVRNRFMFFPLIWQIMFFQKKLKAWLSHVVSFSVESNEGAQGWEWCGQHTFVISRGNFRTDKIILQLQGACVFGWWVFYLVNVLQVFEISPSLHVVELRKLQGESSSYRQVPSPSLSFAITINCFTFNRHLIVLRNKCAVV